MRLKPIIPLVLLPGLLLLGWFNQLPPSSIDPATRFVTIDGQSLTLVELSEQPLLVTFWATNCHSCLAEIPDLIALYQRFQARGFKLVAVSMDYDPPNRVVATAAERRIPYPIALDPQSELSRRFGEVNLTPTSFLLDRGQVVWRRQGRFDAAQLSEWLEQRLPALTNQPH